MKERGGRYTVAVIGGTGREHSLVDQYSEDPNVERIVCIPGNPMMLKNAKKEVEIFREYKGKRLTTTSVLEIVEICKRNGVNLVDVAQDNAVAVGVADAIRKIGIPTIGFGKDAGQLESDKAFSRDFSLEMEIPIPEYAVFTSERAGIDYLRTHPDIRRAIKAAYLAGGKGVSSAKNNKEARAKIRELRRNFPDAARKYLLEEWMLNDDGTAGEEFSAFFIFDGKNWKFLGAAQDYKMSGIGDEGENTGSMGGNSPTLIYTKEIASQTEEIADKTFSGLKKRRIASQGVLYVSGIVLNQSGKKVVKKVEDNMRWGDPEAQLIVPGIGNFFEINLAAAQGDLSSVTIKTDDKKRVSIAGAARGYPGDYSNVVGKIVDGLPEIMGRNGIRVFGAGVGVDDNGNYTVSGTNGRIIHIVGEDETFIDAREKVLAAMGRVGIEGNNLYSRNEISWRDIERERLMRK
jgi:phosphoribosylamine--glycine ligase